MLNEKQKANIHRFDAQMCIDVMHECADRLGLVDIQQYEDIVGTKRRSIYDGMESGKILKFEIGKHKFPCING